MRSAIVGETESLKPSDRRALEKLSVRRSRSSELIDPELLRSAAQITARLEQRLGLLIGRDGRISHVVLGSKTRIYLPDLGRFRLSEARLRRLRLVVFLPNKGKAITKPDQDLLTDLEKLRLDALLVVSVTSQGTPGPAVFGALSPRPHLPGRDAHEIRLESLKAATDLRLEFDQFIEELETSFRSIAPVTRDVHADRAILVGAYTGSAKEAQLSMSELEELAASAGVTVVESIIQRRRQLDPKTLVGAGKVEELVLRSLDLGANLLIFDRELAPAQLRSVTKLTEMKVLDRSMLILDIFAQRAQSSEGRLQVELAQLSYALPRLTEKDSGLSRLSGGIGGRGPGETKLEIGRRRIKDRIADLEKRIEKLHAQRSLRRERRQERGVPVVAIVGYTNAGKSTLLNALTKSEVFVESKMFATLDPSSRRMRFPNEREVLFVDTVGFIRELPSELVTAFRATLEEVQEADLILHLVDSTNSELRRQIDVVDQTLDALVQQEKNGNGAEAEVHQKPRLLVLNKIDQLPEQQATTLASSLNALAVSATKRIGFEELIRRIQEELSECFTGQDPGGFLEALRQGTLHQ